MITVPFMDLAAQRAETGAEIDAAALAALSQNDWVLGRAVEQFEQELADYCGVAGAVGTDSGLSALELALRAVGVGPGDEVITAANTFIATAFAISHTGATPVLVDVDPRTHDLVPSLVEAAVTQRTRAVVPVHLYGQPADMRPLMAVADRHGLAVVEDACQAHGARYHGRRAGSLGHAAAFSFYPSKNLGASGDGGAVVSDDSSLLDEVRLLRNYGMRRKYHHEVVGYNRRLDTLQASLLRVRLRWLDRWNAARQERAEAYARLLGEIGVDPPVVRRGSEHVWHLYVVSVPERDHVRQHLADAGVETGVHYPVPIHRQPAYAGGGCLVRSSSVAEASSATVLSLPMYPQMPLHHVGQAVRALEVALRAVPETAGATA